jgi:hypothetical protein
VKRQESYSPPRKFSLDKGPPCQLAVQPSSETPPKKPIAKKKKPVVAAARPAASPPVASASPKVAPELQQGLHLFPDGLAEAAPSATNYPWPSR